MTATLRIAPTRAILRVSTVVAAVAWAVACGDGATAPPPQPQPPPPPPPPPAAPRPTTVTVSPAASQLIALGATVQLTARVLDQNGQAIAGTTVTWESSDAAVATVDGSGLVTAAGNGAGTITARAGAASGTASVTVRQTAASVELEPGDVTLAAVGDTVRLTAGAFDANGNEVADARFEWESSHAAVATADSTGLVTATGTGTATITASVGSVSGNARIAVVVPPTSPDRRSLETLYETTLGAAWTNATNWLTSAPVGEWHGVEVDAAGRVIGLALAGNNLAGWIPPEIGDFDRLRYLHVDGNDLSGPLPAEIADATGLTSLRIGANALSGPLPRSLLGLSLSEFHYADTGLCVPPYETFRNWLGGIASHAGTSVECAPLTDREILVRLYEATDGPNWDGSTNWLTGAPLGEWYGVTTDAGGRVVRVVLQNNGLQGVLPPEIGGLANLQTLAVSGLDRGLTGPIPPELGQLRQLRRLVLSHNGFVGPIPPEIGNASSLEVLALANNRLTGAIPRELGQLTRLEALYVQLNALSGEVPPALGDLARLRYLEIHRNLLLGPVPAGLLRLELARFNFGGNPGLCAPGTARFVSWLGGIANSSGPYCNADDAAVLERLHETTGGADWARSDGWLAGQPLSDWYGIVTDSIGLVREIDLNGNGLAGTLPPELGDLAGLTALRIGGNDLSGPLPLALTQLRLREFRYSGTTLCVPPGGRLQQWLSTVSSHEGTGLECPRSDDRTVLETLYASLGGPDWARANNWLSDSSIGNWRGVQVDGDGRVVGLSLNQNNLSGRLPAELGNLSRLRTLHLSSNSIVGPIPAAIGDLAELEVLVLSFNPLDGEIPPEIGRLSNLRRLDLASTGGLLGSIPAELGDLGKLEELALNDNRLTGRIPPELGNLSNLRLLVLYQNGLTGEVPAALGGLSQLEILTLERNRLGGAIPPALGNLPNLELLNLRWNTLEGRIPRELGELANLRGLFLRDNRLTGKIPRELGGLSRLEQLELRANSLTGVIPPEIGDLSRLRTLELQQNRLSGSIPAELGNLAALQHLDLTHNRDMRGALPTALTALRQLHTLLLTGTGLCAPREPVFLDWLGGLANGQVARCGGVEGSVAYVTQAVQSVDFPVPLVAGNDALLRVFVRADTSTSESLPDVRARFFLDGAETHVVEIPAQSATIPTEFEEGDLDRSANAVIPGTVLQPGVEMVVEIDPGATLDATLGVTRRLPETGRTEVDVRAMPPFDLTVIPFLAESDADSSVLEAVRDLNAESDLFEDVRSLLPIGGFTVTVHEPVRTGTVELGSVLRETEAIRVMEGRGGYHLGLARQTGALRGVADLGRYSASSVPLPDVIAHELGHNLNLIHAPCGGAAGPDPSFPQRDGSIGAWGFDLLHNVLVPPSDPDLMTYCEPRWISGYNFTNMINHRVDQAGAAAAFSGLPARSLLLWGGVDGEGNLFLDPAIVVDAPPALPIPGGAYRLAGLAADDRELFSLNFDMPIVADAEGRSSFVYALPVDSEWSRVLETIVLSGPEGSTTLDRESDRPVTILLDPAAGRVRAILRDSGAAAMAESAAARSAWATEGLQVLHSPGIPDAASWRRNEGNFRQ